MHVCTPPSRSGRLPLFVLRTIEACHRSFPKTRLWPGSASAERAKTLASRPFCAREDVGYYRTARRGLYSRLNNAATINELLTLSRNGMYRSMPCRSCSSSNQQQFASEICIHLPGDLKTPAVLVFPNLLVCLDCGFTEFTNPEGELRLLRQGGADSTATQ